MALVIFCVALIAAIRLRSSLRDAIGLADFTASGVNVLATLERALELAGCGVSSRGSLRMSSRISRCWLLQRAEQAVLERADRDRRGAVEIAVTPA